MEGIPRSSGYVFKMGGEFVTYEFVTYKFVTYYYVTYKFVTITVARLKLTNL